MTSVNKVIILGNLGIDPELRYTQKGLPVCRLSIATQESPNSESEERPDTQWHRVIVWGNQAINCSKYLKKGRMVFVEGRLKTRMWEDKVSHQKRYATDIIAQSVKFLPLAAKHPEEPKEADPLTPTPPDHLETAADYI